MALHKTTQIQLKKFVTCIKWFFRSCNKRKIKVASLSLNISLLYFRTFMFNVDIILILTNIWMVLYWSNFHPVHILHKNHLSTWHDLTKVNNREQDPHFQLKDEGESIIMRDEGNSNSSQKENVSCACNMCSSPYNPSRVEGYVKTHQTLFIS